MIQLSNDIKRYRYVPYLSFHIFQLSDKPSYNTKMEIVPRKTSREPLTDVGKMVSAGYDEKICRLRNYLKDRTYRVRIG